MDFNVFPDLTLQVVDGLVKNNKDFDLLIVPNSEHTTILKPGYAMRRAWDFLVRNVMGAEPPANYDLSAAAANP
jgi:dipeptidyl aminopeptidase/acylaminoacyl peptidase